MEKDIICIICPVGCTIKVSDDSGAITSSGYTCQRGKQYAEQEFSNPMRILTSAVRTSVPGSPVLPVRTDRPIPREMQMQCMEEIKKCTVGAGVRRHDVVIANILGTGANVVATADLD